MLLIKCSTFGRLACTPKDVNVAYSAKLENFIYQDISRHYKMLLIKCSTFGRLACTPKDVNVAYSAKLENFIYQDISYFKKYYKIRHALLVYFYTTSHEC